MPVLTRSLARKQREDGAARTIQRILVQSLDPISMRPIRVAFHVVRNHVTVSYDAHVLYEYVRRTGDTLDPVTRTPLCECELSRLARRCALPPLSIPPPPSPSSHPYPVTVDLTFSAEDTENVLRMLRDLSLGEDLRTILEINAQTSRYVEDALSEALSGASIAQFV